MDIIIYHSKDLDGLASGAVLHDRFGNEKTKLIGYHYNEDFDVRKMSKKNVVMADVSLDIEKMFSVAKMAKSFTWIDHHFTQFDEFINHCEDKGYTYNVVNLGRIKLFDLEDFDFKYYYSEVLSAAEMCSLLFAEEAGKSEQYKKAIHVLGQYDTWRKKDSKKIIGDFDWESKVLPFQYGMRLSRTVFDVIKKLDDINDWRSLTDIDSITRSGVSILEYEKGVNEINMRASFEIVFRDDKELYRGIAYNGTPFNSQAFLSVYNEENHDFMMPFQFQGTQWNCSLYTTKENIDISKIAISFGGGGHKQACGFQLAPNEIEFKENQLFILKEPIKEK